MRRNRAKLCKAVLAAAISAGVAQSVHAQVATLGKGHTYFVNNGLQIWGLDQGASTFNYINMANANFNGVMWSWGQAHKVSQIQPGQKWGKWTEATVHPSVSLNATEQSKSADLIALQVGDEQQSDIEDPNGDTRAWFQAAHAGNYFPNQLLYPNSFFIINDSTYADFITHANPDAISFDSYPFNDPYGSVILPQNWLSLAGRFRRHALSSYIAVGGNAPRPYGLYLQTYAGTEGAGKATRHPGDVEMRWQQFTAWTMGFSFVDAFTVGGSSSLFDGSSQNSINVPRYAQFKESARQSRNLGPALTKLISYGYGPSIVLGSGSGTAGVPGDWLPFNRTNAPPNQQYLTGVSAQNIGTKNGGQPGDVYIGFFNPLHLDFGDPAGTTYFMITNALGAYLNDPAATVADCLQRITLDFDFGATTINSLQRLRRSDGQVEVVPLTHLAGNQYRLVFDLEGGTGDLFKYNDGSPFVGVQPPVSIMYWDADGVAIGNNTSTGAGLGGGGTWDNITPRWHNGVSNAPWVGGSHAVFFGAAGTVTLGSPQSASSLRFRTDGYTLTGSTLTLTGPNVIVDAGVSATISSVVAGSFGVIKNGPGTLNLTANNTFTGGVTINQGVLGVASGSIGANPGSPQVNIAINNGATLRYLVNGLTLAFNRNMVLGGAAGGVIDTNGFTSAIAGVISGTKLTKTGDGTLSLTNSNTHASTQINQGTLLVTSDANLGAAPASFTSGNLTFDGGTLRFGGNFDIANNRGITLNAGGGTIDTNGFSNPSGYNASAGGFSGPGDLTKIGAGTFFAAATSGGANTTWKGRLIIQEGTWKMVASDGLPYNVPLDDGIKLDQVTLDGGTWQMAANMNITNGRRGLTVAAGGGTIDTQNFNLTWAGAISGTDSSAQLNKIGSGTLRLTATATASTYRGIVNVNQGALVLTGGNAMGDLAAINMANVTNVLLTISNGSEVIGSLAGGGSSGGNVSIASGATLTTGGNNQSTVYSANLQGSGNFVKTGAGTMTLTSPDLHTGSTTVSGGVYSIAGNFSANALVLNGGTFKTTVGTFNNNAFTVTAAGGALDATGTSFSLGATGNTTIGGDVTIAGGTITIARTAGTVSNSSSAAITINPSATLELAGSVAATASLDAVNHGTLNVAAGSHSLDNLDGSGATAVGSALTVDRVRQSALTVNGTLTVRAGGAAGTSEITIVNLGGGGKLNLNDGKLLTQSDIGSWNGSNYGGLTGKISSGRNGGAWDGSGVVTSMSAAQGATALTTIAVAAASDIGRVGTTFGGLLVESGDTMLMYTYTGDADLSGFIDADDFFRIDSGFLASASGYSRGDFNYDGRVDADDYFLINANYVRQGTPFSSAAAIDGVTVVPEPVGAAALALMALSCIGCRRRRV